MGKLSLVHSLEIYIGFRLYYLTVFLCPDAKGKILLQFPHIWVILGREHKSPSRMWCVLCNLLLLTSGRSGKIHISLWQASDSLPTFILISYPSGKKSACLWFMVTDSETPLMINCAALRFCCGAYLWSPHCEASKCLMSFQRQTVKLTFPQESDK